MCNLSTEISCGSISPQKRCLPCNLYCSVILCGKPALQLFCISSMRCRTCSMQTLDLQHWNVFALHVQHHHRSSILRLFQCSTGISTIRIRYVILCMCFQILFHRLTFELENTWDSTRQWLSDVIDLCHTCLSSSTVPSMHKCHILSVSIRGSCFCHYITDNLEERRSQLYRAVLVAQMGQAIARKYPHNFVNVVYRNQNLQE